MITYERQSETAEQAVATINGLLRQSRRTIPPEANRKMARAWLLELQERAREILVFLSGLEMSHPRSVEYMRARKKQIYQFPSAVLAGKGEETMSEFTILRTEPFNNPGHL